MLTAGVLPVTFGPEGPSSSCRGSSPSRGPHPPSWVPVCPPLLFPVPAAACAAPKQEEWLQSDGHMGTASRDQVFGWHLGRSLADLATVDDGNGHPGASGDPREQGETGGAGLWSCGHLETATRHPGFRRRDTQQAAQSPRQGQGDRCGGRRSDLQVLGRVSH